MNADLTSNTNIFAITGYNQKEPLTKQQQEKIENIKKNLTMDVKETNAYKRKKISAHDDRPSAKAVGSILGIGVLSVVFCLIVIPDIPMLIRDFGTEQCRDKLLKIDENMFKRQFRIFSISLKND